MFTAFFVENLFTNLSCYQLLIHIVLPAHDEKDVREGGWRMKILKMCGYCRWLEVTDSRLGGVRTQGEEAVYTWTLRLLQCPYTHYIYSSDNTDPS